MKVMKLRNCKDTSTVFKHVSRRLGRRRDGLNHDNGIRRPISTSHPQEEGERQVLDEV